MRWIGPWSVLERKGIAGSLHGSLDVQKKNKKGIVQMIAMNKKEFDKVYSRLIEERILAGTGLEKLVPNWAWNEGRGEYTMLPQYKTNFSKSNVCPTS